MAIIINFILKKNLFNRGLNINISIKICDTALVHNLEVHIIVIHCLGLSIVITATKVCLTDPIKFKYPVIRHLKNDIVRWPINVMLSVLWRSSLSETFITCYFLLSNTTETPQNNAVHNPHGTPLTPHCSQTYYGCCPDGSTAASGPQSQGCPQDQSLPSCTWSRYTWSWMS